MNLLMRKKKLEPLLSIVGREVTPFQKALGLQMTERPSLSCISERFLLPASYTLLIKVRVDSSQTTSISWICVILPAFRAFSRPTNEFDAILLHYYPKERKPTI